MLEKVPSSSSEQAQNKNGAWFISSVPQQHVTPGREADEPANRSLVPRQPEQQITQQQFLQPCSRLVALSVRDAAYNCRTFDSGFAYLSL